MKKLVVILIILVAVIAMNIPEKEGDVAWFDGVGQCEYIDGEWRPM